MNEIDIQMFPASFGDSFLITCRGQKNTHIMIDMGFKHTYNNFIKQELKALKSNNDKISLLVFTHIDEDHILGGIGFLQDKADDKSAELIDVDEIWYNSYKHLQFDKKEEMKKKELEKLHLALNKIVKRGHPRERGVRQVSNISVKQATTLSGLLYKNNYAPIWNKSYAYEAVVVKENNSGLHSIFINEEVKLTVLSPNNQNLKDLEEKWEEKLSEWGFTDKVPQSEIISDAFEIYMANEIEKKKKKNSSISIGEETIEEILKQPFIPDKKEINGSSIAFILEFYDKKVLFLGDSHSETIERSLKKIMEFEGLSKLKFDAVKISHHGSKHNTSLELLNMIETPKYIISTNGRGKGFQHPDIETLYKIVSADFQNRKAENRKIELIFNYKPIHIIGKISVPELQEKYMYDVIFTNDISKAEKEKSTLITITSERKSL